MKGTGGLKRLQAGLAVKASLARRLMPLENKVEKYSATSQTQMSLPISGNLSIPYSTIQLRKAYAEGGMNEVELKVVQVVMQDIVNSIKCSMALGYPYTFIAYSSNVLSPFLWDVIVLWLKSCQYVVDEDIREVVLIEDCQNQGSTRVKLMFGAKVGWGSKGVLNEQV